MFSGAVLVRSDAQFDFEELSLIAFALGLGVGVLAAVRLFVIFAFDLGMVVAAFVFGVGVGLLILDLVVLTCPNALFASFISFVFGVGVGFWALAASMLPVRAIAVIANVFSSVFLIFILPTTKSIAVRALLLLSFCARILCRPANHHIEEWSHPKDGRQTFAGMERWQEWRRRGEAA